MCSIHRFLAVALVIFFNFGQAAFADKKQDPAKEQVAAYEKAILTYVDSLGTDDEDTVGRRMDLQRNKVIELGKPAIPHLCDLLKHKQVNVRRGSGIALSYIVRKNKLKDEKLLDQVLLRMIYEEDIKARSNLYHVVNGLIDNLKPEKPKSEN